MICGVFVAVGVAGGYFLGRTKKMKLALMLGGMAAGRAGGPGQLIAQASKLLRQSPELARLTDEVGGRLLETGKGAAIAIATRQVESLTDRVGKRVESLGDVGSARGKRPRKEPEPDEYDDEHDDESADQAAEPDDVDESDVDDQPVEDDNGANGDSAEADEEPPPPGPSRRRPATAAPNNPAEGTPARSTSATSKAATATLKRTSGSTPGPTRRATTTTSASGKAPRQTRAGGESDR